MDYINASSMYQNQNSVPNNPFWSGVQGANYQRMAAPFLQNELQSSNLDLQKKAMETGEFTGQQAQDMRSTQRQSETATAQYNIDTRPDMTAHEKKRLQEEIRALPSMTDQKIAQAKQATMTAEGMPHRELLAEIGSSYDTISDLPEEHRPRAWDSMVQRWQQTHPGAKLPDSFRQYSPEHLADAGAIRYNQLNSPEQIGKERVADIQQTGETTRANMAGQYANQRATIAAEAHIKGAQLHLQAGETPPKAEARLRRELRADRNNEDARRELKGYLENIYDKEYEKTGRGQMLQMQGLGDPKIQQQYQIEQEQYKARKFMNDENFYGDLSATERDWVIRAIGAKNPKTGQYDNLNMDFASIIALGKQIGKIKGKK